MVDLGVEMEVVQMTVGTTQAVVLVVALAAELNAK